MSILTADFYICYFLFLKCFYSPTCLMISSSSSYSITLTVISSRKRLHWSHWGNHVSGSSINDHFTLKWNSLHVSLSLSITNVSFLSAKLYLILVFCEYIYTKFLSFFASKNEDRNINIINMIISGIAL